jgi:hypothetical protein
MTDPSYDRFADRAWNIIINLGIVTAVGLVITALIFAIYGLYLFVGAVL